MKYKVDNKVNRSIKGLIDRAIEGTIDIPDNSVVLHLAQERLPEIITKKRLEVIDTIKRKNPKSVVELARILNRKVQAVDRDLKLLERYGLVSLKREGQTATPVVEKEVIIIPLVRPKTLEKIRMERISKLKEELSQLTKEEREKLFKEASAHVVAG